MIKGKEYLKIDWYLILSYLLLMIIGWLSIYSAVYDPTHSSIFDTSQRYGMQMIWIVTSIIIAFGILFIVSSKLYQSTSWLIYAISLIVLLSVVFLGTEINGSKSWFQIGSFRFQPAEISKITTSLALASLFSKYNFSLKRFNNFVKASLIILVPIAIIIMQKETGSALVFFSMIFMFYREGLSGWILIIGVLAIILFLITLSISPFASIIFITSLLIIARGIVTSQLTKHIIFLFLYFPIMFFSPKIQDITLISENIVFLAEELWLGLAITPIIIYQFVVSIKKRCAKQINIALCFFLSMIFIFSVEIFFEKILQEHQKNRIENFLGINVDLKGAGYNVHQSKIAIGSGGLTGKGFLQGTQTKFNFVPEQSTDFIFCSIGEERGFIGSSFVVFLFAFMIIRIIIVAEKQKETFNRVFGYCLASVFFTHFFINIGMTMGLVPVIGIPLPFVSYGGSSLWSFTIFLFIFIRLDLDRWK